MAETYLVTGGSGLAGHYVLRALIDRGYDPDQIIAYDLDPRAENIADIEDEFILVEGDVTDETTLLETFERYRPTRVIHLAALLIYDAWDDPSAVVKVNGLGTNAVFDAARIYDVDRCVYASSGSVYGNAANYGDDTVVQENDLVKPSGAYGATKYLNEVVGRQYNEHYDPEYVGVRIGGAWGRGRLSGSTGEFTSFVREAALGQEVALPEAWVDIFGTDGDVYVAYGKDVGRWWADLATTEGVEHTIYNQRNKKPFTLAEVASILEEQVPGTTVEVPDGASKPDGAGSPHMDASRWYDELGFAQEWDIESALIDFANYHRKREGLEPV